MIERRINCLLAEWDGWSWTTTHVQAAPSLSYLQDVSVQCYWRIKPYGKTHTYWLCVTCEIFEPRRDEVTGEWRNLHNKELYDLYCSPNIVRVMKSRRMRWAGHVARMGERGVHTGFWWGKPAGKSPLGRPRRRWENNIEMDRQKMGCGGMDWIQLA